MTDHPISDILLRYAKWGTRYAAYCAELELRVGGAEEPEVKATRLVTEFSGLGREVRSHWNGSLRGYAKARGCDTHIDDILDYVNSRLGDPAEEFPAVFDVETAMGRFHKDPASFMVEIRDFYDRITRIGEEYIDSGCPAPRKP